MGEAVSGLVLDGAPLMCAANLGVHYGHAPQIKGANYGRDLGAAQFEGAVTGEGWVRKREWDTCYASWMIWA